MGANTSRKTKVLVSNATAANTGNSMITDAGASKVAIVDNDVILFDRTFTELADTATIHSNKNADVLYLALGTGAAGASEMETIQTKNIRKITVASYVAPAQRVATITGENFNLAANTDYSISLEFHDTGRTMNDKPTRQFFVYTSGASAPTQAAVVNALVTKINAAKLSYVVASNVSDDLVITGKAVTPNSINSYQFVNFEVSMRSGFIAEPTDVTYTGGNQGQGHGQIVKDMELENTNNFNRIQWPLDEDTRRATNAGKYNLVVIEHATKHTGDFLQDYSAPRTAVVAFATTDGTSSAKQTAFIEKLTSIAESVGVYVSDVTPA
jgi:hypothetical protein